MMQPETKINAPGPMCSDISPVKLRDDFWTLVKNLRITKDGEFEAIKGYLIDHSALGTDVKGAMEFTNDLAPAASDRFILYQDGQVIKRLDYNDTNGNYATGSISSLPIVAKNVTLESGDKVRFFSHNGVIRITGTSSPLWYGYIERELFASAGESDTIEISGWTLEKAEITPSPIEMIVPFEDEHYVLIGDEVDTENALVFYKLHYFLEYDRSQYSALAPATWEGYDIQATFATRNGKIAFAFYLNATNIETAYPNNRITGLGIVSEDMAGVFRVIDYLPFDQDVPPVTYKASVKKGSTNYKIEWAADLDSHAVQEGYFAIGQKVDLIGKQGEEITGAVVTDVTYQVDENFSGMSTVTFDVDISAIFITAGYEDIVVKFYRNWTKPDANNYRNVMSANFAIGTEYYEFTSIPAGTSQSGCNYSHHIVAGGRAYVLSRETGELDMLRYSPINQLDVFPETFLMATQVGDIDENKAITVRDDRVVILKGMSVSQGQLSGDSYSQDIGFSKRGLYSQDGHIVVDNVLYWIGKDDLYAFDGTQIAQLTRDTKIRQHYQLYIKTTSFLLYDKTNDELWVVLGTTGNYCYAMVYQFQQKAWYVREIYLAIVAGFIDSQGQLMAVSAAKLLRFNHSATTFGETISAAITTGIDNLGAPSSLKNLLEFWLTFKSSVAWALTISDPEDARSYTATITPASSTVVKLHKEYPRLINKGFQVALTSAESATLTATIRELTSIVARISNV